MSLSLVLGRALFIRYLFDVLLALNFRRKYMRIALLYFISLVLIFGYKFIYLISESWKSDGYSECSKMYKISCQFGGISLFIITTYLLIKFGLS